MATRRFSSKPVSTSPSRTQDYFSLGAEPGGGLQYVGLVDRLKVSSGVLTAAELDSEPLDPTSAETAANYSLSGGVTVSAATLAGPNRVRLTTSAQAENTPLTLTVNDVEDLTGNMIAATFTGAAVANAGGSTTVSYQWQRDDGNGFVAIDGATGSAYRLYPAAADFDATFQLVASVLNKSIASHPVKVIEGAVEAPEISVGLSVGTVSCDDQIHQAVYLSYIPSGSPVRHFAPNAQAPAEQDEEGPTRRRTAITFPSRPRSLRSGRTSWCPAMMDTPRSCH